MPCWNASATIERAIGSVLDETDVPLECVVIDDGSTDDTARLVEAIARRDDRVVLLRLPTNGGVSNARNRGLEIARGEWLTFLDADDRLLPGGVAALMRPTRDPVVRIVLGQRHWTDGQRTWVSKFYDIPDITEPGRKSIATHPGLLYYASSTGKAIHRSLVEGLRFEGRVLGDQPWAIAAMLRAGTGIEVIGDLVYEWWRPRADEAVETIGTATRASTERAAAMADMAAVVYRAVSAETDVCVADPETRLLIKQTYLDRLIRSDLSLPVRQALDRRDPATARLYTAVARFLESLPAAVLARSLRAETHLIRPGLYRWADLVPSARSSYFRMLRPLLRARPDLVRTLGGRRRVVPLMVLRSIWSPLATAAALAWFAVLPPPRRALGTFE